MNPIFYAIIEGPDCSGKTTFARSLNEKCCWSLNVKDRSYLSTLVYSQLYDRDLSHPRWGFSQEILNMNNVLILLLPPLEVVMQRFEKRGDDIQNIHTIKDVYFAFESWANEIELLPNVIVVRDKNPDVSAVWAMIQDIQKMPIEAVANRAQSLIVSRFINTQESDWEVLGLTFNRWLREPFASRDISSVVLPQEKAYYENIKSAFYAKIMQEISRDMMSLSRRFVYASDTCISLIQCLYRENSLQFFVHFRSSNTFKVLESDLVFLENLMIETRDAFFSECGEIRATYTIGSAHVIV